MRFKDVFSIIGPSMIGPSSSHTAGAVRLGRVARQLLGTVPSEAQITLFGSFAETYQGHGTDLALIGGLLGYDTDHPRIRHSFEDAAGQGMRFEFHTGQGQSWHPNTAQLLLRGDGRELNVTGSSIGGGNIEIIGIDGFEVKFTGHYPTIVLTHRDRPGMIAEVTALLSRRDLNIGHMDVDRKGRNGEAMTVLELDRVVSDDGSGTPLMNELAELAGMFTIRYVDLGEGGSGA